MIFADKIQINHQFSPVGISTDGLYVSWTVGGAKRQTGFQVSLYDGKTVIYDSGRTESAQMSCTISMQLPYKAEISVCVRLWGENGDTGLRKTTFETGPDLKTLDAEWINPEGKINPKKRQRASYLKKIFSVERLGRGRIYATSHGIFDVYLNGVHLDDRLLMPGTTQYDTRLTMQTIDCTSALRIGKNELLVTLGDGWYRGCRGNNLDANVFGNDVALLLQLEIDGKTICVTGKEWLASQNGPLGYNDLTLGETYDAQKEEITDWQPVSVASFGTGNLIYPESVPVRKKETFSARLLMTPAGKPFWTLALTWQDL